MSVMSDVMSSVIQKYPFTNGILNDHLYGQAGVPTKHKGLVINSAFSDYQQHINPVKYLLALH